LDRKTLTSAPPDATLVLSRLVEYESKEDEMSVSVEIPTTLRDYTGGERSVEGSGDCLAELLTDLDQRHPGLRARLVNDDGTLRRFINIYINDDDIRYDSSLASRLNAGDKVSIIPAVAGGC
jgi:molybdopterin converting factor small subunit